MRARETIQPGRPPLRLAIEPYVRCPRGGLVPVERCFGCQLLQGTLGGEIPKILCAYSEAAPALRRTESSATPVGPGPAVRVAPRRRIGDRPSSELIFESDWPEE